MNKCFNCNETGHTARKCPLLHDVLNDGFYTGGNGGGGHDHDEEESTPCVRIPFVSSYRHPYVSAGQGKNEHNVQFRLTYPYLTYQR